MTWAMRIRPFPRYSPELGAKTADYCSRINHAGLPVVMAAAVILDGWTPAAPFFPQ